MKKARFHYEVAAMAGHETARINLGCLENDSGNIVRALKHWLIAASAGCFRAMDVEKRATSTFVFSNSSIAC